MLNIIKNSNIKIYHITKDFHHASIINLLTSDSIQRAAWNNCTAAITKSLHVLHNLNNLIESKNEKKLDRVPRFSMANFFTVMINLIHRARYCRAISIQAREPYAQFPSPLDLSPIRPPPRYIWLIRNNERDPG